MINLLKCTGCKEIKSVLNFYARNDRAKGVVSRCKQCYSIKNSNISDESRRKKSERTKIRYAQNREKFLDISRKWRIANKEYRRKYFRNREDSDIQYKLRCALRNRIRCAIKHDARSGSAINDLGCSIEYFKNYLEKQFSSGMTWDNYGDWHIDHKKPLISFDLTDPEQFRKAVHFTNLQPLWAMDNLSKGTKCEEATA
jgi:hypothetical protein